MAKQKLHDVYANVRDPAYRAWGDGRHDDTAAGARGPARPRRHGFPREGPHGPDSTTDRQRPRPSGRNREWSTARDLDRESVKGRADA